jgi:NAD+ synthase
MPAEVPPFVTRIRLDPERLEAERHRIVSFLRDNLSDDPAVCAVSGGLDSDLATRLVVEAIGSERVKLFIVEQDDFDPRFTHNATHLADDLGLELITIDLRGLPAALIGSLQRADPAMSFRVDGLLDVGRAKCSLRTAILSTYQDRGYRVIGNSNRTEWLTGFFLPFGDGLAHAQPIIHLYKSQVAQLAAVVGTAPEVIDQPGSSGFWVGAEDLLDLSFWLYAGGPIRQERVYTDHELSEIYGIREQLNRELLDATIDALTGDGSVEQISIEAELPVRIVEGLQSLLTSAAWKHVPFFERVTSSA